MTVVVLRPDGTVTSTGLSDATPHVEVSDNTDGTVIASSLGAIGNTLMTLGTSTLPAGSVTKQVGGRLKAKRTTGATSPGRAKLRVQKSDGTVLLDDQSFGFTSTSTLDTQSTAVVPVTLSQADVDGLRVWVQTSRNGGNYQATISEVYVDLTYVAAPVVTLESAVVTADSVTQVWAYNQSDTDGGPQTQWWARVFTAAQYGAAGFDPATSVATAEASGSGATTRSVTLAGLPDGANHRVYVAAADAVNGQPLWSVWTVFNTFTISSTRAQVSAVTVTPVPASATVTVSVDRNTGLDAWTGVEVERMSAVNIVGSVGQMEGTAVAGVVGGWTAGNWVGAPTGVTWSAQTVAGHGQVQRVVLTTASGSSVLVRPTLFFQPVAPGDTVQVVADCDSADWHNCAPQLVVVQFTSSGALAGSQVLPMVDRTTGWRRYATSFTVPVGVAFIAPGIGVGDIGGTSASTQVDIDNVSAFINGVWVPVAGSRFAASGNNLSVTDRLAAGDKQHVFRARAANAGGAIGSWLYSATATVAPTVTVLRDVTMPTLEWFGAWEVDGFPEDGWEVPGSALDVIGRTAPVVVYDAPKRRGGQFRVECLTLADSDALMLLLDGRELALIQSSALGPSMRIRALGTVDRDRGDTQIVGERRYVTADYQRVD